MGVEGRLGDWGPGEGDGGLAWKHREWGCCCDLTQTSPLVTRRASMSLTTALVLTLILTTSSLCHVGHLLLEIRLVPRDHEGVFMWEHLYTV